MDLITYILPSRQEREISVFEATRTCVWLNLMLADDPTAFTIFLHRRHGRFIVCQFNPYFRIEILRSQSVYHLRRPRLPPSRLLPRPDSIALNDRIKHEAIL